MAWSDYDQKKKPVGNACLNCWETLQEVSPETQVETAIAMRGSKDPSSQEWFENFDQCRQVRLGEIDRPWFTPKSDVDTTTSYSMQIYHKIGLVTETDLLRLTGLAGKQIKKYNIFPVSLKVDGPHAPAMILYPISLKGLPADEIAGILKAKIQHVIQCNHHESVLQAENQLCQEQGPTLFGIVCNALGSNKPIIKEPGKIPDLRRYAEIKAEVDAARASVPGLQQAKSDSEDEAEVDEATAANVTKAARARARAGFSVGTMAPKAKASGKSKAAGKGRGRGAAAVAAIADKGAGRDVSPAGSGKASVAPSATKSSLSRSKHDRQVEETLAGLEKDEEMQKVARKHLLSGKNVSVKCLHFLNVHEILSESSSSSKLGNHIQGARGLKNMLHWSLMVIKDF